MKPFVLGKTIELAGTITTNNWVGARSAGALEQSLGYGKGRLAAGWWILVLKQRLSPDDFIFGGITLRSGGRYGLTAGDAAADRLRPGVHDTMVREQGEDQVRNMQAAMKFSYEGPERLAKVVPFTPHSEDMAPSRQYPMGGGGGQWTLKRPRLFLVAVQVDENAIARTPTFSVLLGESAPYEDRAKLHRYLLTA
jgi:hypothetical protein